MDKQTKKSLTDLLRVVVYWFSLLLMFKVWSMWFIKNAASTPWIIDTFFAQIVLMMFIGWLWHKVVTWLFK